MGIVSDHAAILSLLETKYGIDSHKLQLLGLAQAHWEQDIRLRVTDLLKSYSGTCRAITHRSIKELEDAKMFKLVSGGEDKRERLVHPGAFFSRLEKILEGWK